MMLQRIIVSVLEILFCHASLNFVQFLVGLKLVRVHAAVIQTDCYSFMFDISIWNNLCVD